ncbi:MAG: hypothetical protein DRP74_03285 [Candidatus Omnitrophota bacterium]|nr:MAG: hypothetical protein DRP74_03285 [Candidatus Omnitrophota bacterium]
MEFEKKENNQKDIVKKLELDTIQTKEELRKTKDELQLQMWGLAKTNEAIRVLYKELEKKNKELEKLDQLKSDFINSVSHELRTPLTSIREVISQILDGILGETNQQQREFLNICLADVDRLRRIIDDLLDISKLEAGKLKLSRADADIVGLAKRVISTFQAEFKSAGLEIKENFPQEKAVAYVDQDRIIQVFINLIGNAFKFTEKGYVDVSVIDWPGFVECSVADTGIGIGEEDLPKLFGKFQQFNRKDPGRIKGTGLGLSISKNIIELHRGQIEVESKLDKGTKFTFTLPKYNPQELYKEHIIEGIQKASSDKGYLSVSVFGIKNLSQIAKNIDNEKLHSATEGIINVIKKNLRFGEDLVIKDTHTVMIVLPGVEKQKAAEISQRIYQAIKDFLTQRKIELDVFNEVVSFPQDGDSQEKICDKLSSISGT